MDRYSLLFAIGAITYLCAWQVSHGATGVGDLPDTPTSVRETTRQPRLVVLDIELSGDLGGPEMVADHEARLKMESARLRADLAKTQRYLVIDTAPAQNDIVRLKLQQMYLHDCNGCDLDIGRELKGDQVLVSWVNRVSGLILTLTYEIHDVATGLILARQSFDFRGDSDSAWSHAVDYMVRHMQE
jgi:hypothetical protein